MITQIFPARLSREGGYLYRLVHRVEQTKLHEIWDRHRAIHALRILVSDFEIRPPQRRLKVKNQAKFPTFKLSVKLTGGWAERLK